MNSIGFQRAKVAKAFIIDELVSVGSFRSRIDAFVNFQIPPAYANRIRADACQKCQINCARLAHQQFRSRVDYARVFRTRVSRELNKQRRHDFAESSSDVFPICRYFAPDDRDYFVLLSRDRKNVRMRGTHTRRARDFRTI